MDASPGAARCQSERLRNLSETDDSELNDTVDRQNDAKWAARLVGAGSLLTLIYETAFLVLDRRFLSLSDPPVLVFHSINIALFLLAVIMAARAYREGKKLYFDRATETIVEHAPAS